MEEMSLLYHRYGKRGFVWVDESWNIDPRFNEAFSDAMIESGMKTMDDLHAGRLHRSR